MLKNNLQTDWSTKVILNLDSATILSVILSMRSPMRVRRRWPRYFGVLESAERFEPLWAQMGFPLSWWSGLETRVLESSYFFGLCPTLDNYEWARARLNQPSNGDYISGMIENFVEVCLRIRRSNLDVVALASNWDRLLHYAQLYQVQVDDEVEALALQTLERLKWRPRMTKISCMVPLTPSRSFG